MIHAYNYQFDEHERDTHGYYFMRKVHELQPKVPFKIPIKHEMEDDERGVAKPISFIAGQKTDGTEIVSLFSPRAFTDPQQEQDLKRILDQWSSRMKWISGGIGTSSLANSMKVQRAIGRSITSYRVKTSLIAPNKIISSHGEAPAQFKSNEPIS